MGAGEADHLSGSAQKRVGVRLWVGSQGEGLFGEVGRARFRWAGQ